MTPPPGHVHGHAIQVRLNQVEVIADQSTKERLVRAAADGQSLRGAARRVGVAVTAVKRAVGQQRETGALARQHTELASSPTALPAGGAPFGIVVH